jgi:diadenosine tetraphosphate (Ap4A) HIT family hydrolase
VFEGDTVPAVSSFFSPFLFLLLGTSLEAAIDVQGSIKDIGSTGINLLHASGVAAQQSVPHLHIHLIPRFDRDCLDAWPKLKIRQDNKDDLLKKLRLPSRTA